jgi:hypothetical protein
MINIYLLHYQKKRERERERERFLNGFKPFIYRKFKKKKKKKKPSKISPDGFKSSRELVGILSYGLFRS